MNDRNYAIAHDYALQVPAPDGVARAIGDVMALHRAELDAALEPFGVALEDLLLPTWMRAVDVDDVVGFNGGRGDLATPDPEPMVEVRSGELSGLVPASAVVRLDDLSPEEDCVCGDGGCRGSGSGAAQVVQIVNAPGAGGLS